MSINIRSARIEDAHAIAEAERQIAQKPGFFCSQPSELTDENVAHTIASFQKDKKGVYLVAESGNQIVGHAFLEPHPLQSLSHVADLNIAVHIGWQGQGIGKQLLQEIIEWAKHSSSIEKIQLNVRALNTAAISLYKKMGFREEGRLLKRLKVKDQYIDDIVMGLDLTEPSSQNLDRKRKRSDEERDPLINKIIHWAKDEKSVRAVILVGSRAENSGDEFSDYDLSLFCDDATALTCDDSWLSEIGCVWVCVHEKVRYCGEEFPSRLVIFEKGIKVDLTFYSTQVLKEVSSAPQNILLDKDRKVALASGKKKPFIIEKPSPQEFLTVINEFWFEVYHVAVYLKRGDLWLAQMRLNGLRQQFLLKMVEWNELSKQMWKASVYPFGKRLQSSVSEKTWEALCSTFSLLNEAGCWMALENSIELFRVLAIETAFQLGLIYPKDVDDHIFHFIKQLRGGSSVDML